MFEWVKDFCREPTEADLASALYKIADNGRPGAIIEMTGAEWAAYNEYMRRKALTCRE